jgi:hypothetical protein
LAYKAEVCRKGGSQSVFTVVTLPTPTHIKKHAFQLEKLIFSRNRNFPFEIVLLKKMPAQSTQY